MSPIPVITKFARDDGYADASHRREPSVEVSGSSRFADNVPIWHPRIEAAGDAMVRPRTCQVLSKQMGVAERMAEQSLASLVEVLAIDEDHDPRLRVSRKFRDSVVRCRHEQESPGRPKREAGARKAL